jgi:hypothetical protein
MKQYGHIKLSRKFFETDERWNARRQRTEVEAWIDLIQLAAWKADSRRIAGASVRLLRGQFACSLHFLSDRWMWNRSSVRRFLISLANEGKIVKHQPTQETKHLTKHQMKHLPDVYLIAKYDTYQGTPVGNETVNETPNETADETPTGTRKEEAVKAITTHGAYPADFELLWAQYPNRKPNNPKGLAFKAFSARLREQISYQAMFDGTQRYAKYVAATGAIGTRFVKQGSVFYGPARHFAESWEIEGGNAHADPLGSTSSALKDSWLVKNGYASEDAA